MEKIIWAIISILLSLPHISYAQCGEHSLQEDFAIVKQQLLEGSLQQAQGTMFAIREQIHCHTFTSSDYQLFLFYTAIYHHLLSNPERS